MIQTDVIKPLRQRLQNCGSSLTATDFKALLDALEKLESNTNDGIKEFITEAPKDGKKYVRLNGAWVPLELVEKPDSGIEEVLTDLAFRVKAVGKSNSSMYRDKWEYDRYSTVFNNFNWIDNGWLKDKENNAALKLTGDANASINIRPFNMDIPTEGLTYTIEYSTEDVTDYEAVIMEQIVEGVGIKITPTYVSINSYKTYLTGNLDSLNRVSVSFSIQKRNSQRLMGIYINGILSRAIQYSISDYFYQNYDYDGDLKISTGNRKATVYVYTVRWYRNNLEDAQILSNYIYDRKNSTS